MAKEYLHQYESLTRIQRLSIPSEPAVKLVSQAVVERILTPT
jgi:hypothetical protein